MTREEAINWLKAISFVSDHRITEAIDMAIESLSAEPSEQYKKGFEDAKRAFELEYARESENMRKRNAQLEVMLNAQKAISADAVQGWIPCSERLPKRDELVLVTYKTTDRIHLCRYIDDGSENPWWSYIDDCCAWNNVVLAWMPLPKPYGERREP